MNSQRVENRQSRVIEEILYEEYAEEGQLKEYSRMIGAELDTILQSNPLLGDLRDTLCLLDVVLVLPGSAGNYSRGFLLTPDAEAGRTYRELLEEELLPKCFDVAGHPVFAAGLPKFRGEDGSALGPIHTTRALRLAQDGNPVQLGGVELGWFHEHFGEPGAPGAVEARGGPLEMSVEPWTISRKSTSGQHGGDDRDVWENIHEFVRLLKSRSEISRTAMAGRSFP